MRPSETRSYEHAVDAHVRVHALQCPCAMFCHAHGMSPNPTACDPSSSEPSRLEFACHIQHVHRMAASGEEMPEAGAGAGETYDDSDSEDEVFIDPNDPDAGGRVVCAVDGHDDDDEGDVDMDAEDEEEAGAAEAMDDSEPVLDTSKGRIQGHTDAVYAVAVHPSNSDLIASASGDDTGALWSRATKQRIATLGGHTDTVVQVAFSTSGHHSYVHGHCLRA